MSKAIPIIKALIFAIFCFFVTSLMAKDYEVHQDSSTVSVSNININEFFEYDYKNNKVYANDTIIDQATRTHIYIILPFLQNAINTVKDINNKKIKVDSIEYHYYHYSISLNHISEIESSFDIDIFSFTKYDTFFKECIDSLQSNDYTILNAQVEAPIQCLLCVRNGYLIAVWCHLFANTAKVLLYANEFLSHMQK